MKKYIVFDIVMVACIILFSVLVWLPTQYYPYHWDAAGYIINEAYHFLQTNFSTITSQNSDFAHPPLFPLLLAGFWRLFGVSGLVSHLYVFPSLPIAMISMYFLVAKLFNRQGAVIVSLLLGTAPVVLAEYGNVYPDLPASALTLTAMMLWAYQKKMPSMIVLSLAALTKETALLSLPFFLLYPESFSGLKSPKKYLPLLIPMLLTLSWFIYHGISVGWYLVRPGRPTVIVGSISELYRSITYVGMQIVVSQNRWLFGLLALVSLGVLYFKKKQRLLLTSPMYAAFALFISGLLFFSIGGEFAMRYGLLLIAVYYFLVVFVTSAAISFLPCHQQSSILLMVGVAGLSANLLMWHPIKAPLQTFDFRPPTDLTYADMIDVFRQLGMYSQIENNQPIWYGAFPENIYLTQPYQGYVTNPIEFSLCNKFALNPNRRQLIVYHPYSPGQMDCQNLLQTVSVKPYRQLSKGDSWLEVFEVTATASATP